MHSSASDHPLSTDSIRSQLPPQPERKYAPPIIIDDPSNAAQLIKSFNELTDSKVEGKFLPNNRLKVFPTSADAHRDIQEELLVGTLRRSLFSPLSLTFRSFTDVSPECCSHRTNPRAIGTR
ncbi:hypothetical protein AVEN_250801-1 [Araneus ventricosus]|uniref:Uncharacterized protein n=1 Tax=Araneus ventricosus TaxID=182803 RepID=A0A4Y2UJ81_ARAVE|nr:hypothetical protein AVEN_250801-1 [Araneus ventricosus]